VSPMLDLLLVLLSVGAFLLLAAYVRLCASV
jgi:hypothetical protein